MSGKYVREETLGFTDASYIRQDDAPNMPRCYSFTEEKSTAAKCMPPLLGLAGLCLAIFVTGALFMTETTGSETPAAEHAGTKGSFSTETVSASVAAAVSAAEADDLPSAENISSGERPYLGVIVQTVSDAAAEYYNDDADGAMVPGVQVYAVEDGGPASQAGLCSGDIIVRLDDAAIATAEDLTAAEKSRMPGSKAVLTVFRAGEYREVPVVFSAPPKNNAEEDEGEWCDFDNAW